jgi:predicted Zn finger-like uncharacterized protein
MMMQCPRCSTRWRVAVASPVDNPLFKCGRCHHLFRQFPGAPPASEAAVAPSKRDAALPEPDTLEFIFPDRQSPALVVEDEPAPVAAARAPVMAPAQPLVESESPFVAAESAETIDAEPDPEPERDAARPTIAADAPEAERRGLDQVTEVTEIPVIVQRPDVVVAPPPRPAKKAPLIEDEAEPELEFGDDLLTEPTSVDDVDVNDDGDAAREMVLGDVDDERDDEDDADDVDDDGRARESTGRTFRVEDAMKAPAGFGTIMRAMGMAVSGFAALALVIRVAPEQASRWLSYLPVAGQSFARENSLSTKIELKNVQGRFQRLRNARRVFVISGDARNNSPMTIERIEVAGALYDLGGGELDQKVVTTGNRTALTDLSEAEIVLLQRLDPVIALAPGETTPFLIVFLEPPRELSEFSSRVLSVRPTRRASTPASSHRDSVG